MPSLFLSGRVEDELTARADITFAACTADPLADRRTLSYHTPDILYVASVAHPCDGQPAGPFTSLGIAVVTL